MRLGSPSPYTKKLYAPQFFENTLMCRIIEVTIIKVESRMCRLIVEANFPFNSSVCLALYKYYSLCSNAINIAGIFFLKTDWAKDQFQY